ncbi:MAG: hypothetical protein K9L61_00920 [Candidatus Omnitrophica bacterium]|nr:hypothetical protein [Candidatus Omnitrophota bacterium]
MKRVALYLLIALVGIISSGCATTTRTASGAVVGAVSVPVNTVYGFGSGIAKDTRDTTNAIMKADQWFRKNLW